MYTHTQTHTSARVCVCVCKCCLGLFVCVPATRTEVMMFRMLIRCSPDHSRLCVCTHTHTITGTHTHTHTHVHKQKHTQTHTHIHTHTHRQTHTPKTLKTLVLSHFVALSMSVTRLFLHLHVQPWPCLLHSLVRSVHSLHALASTVPSFRVNLSLSLTDLRTAAQHRIMLLKAVDCAVFSDPRILWYPPSAILQTHSFVITVYYAPCVHVRISRTII